MLFYIRCRRKTKIQRIFAVMIEKNEVVSENTADVKNEESCLDSNQNKDEIILSLTNEIKSLKNDKSC